MPLPRTPLVDWLDHLRVLHPPQHVAVVGAGNGGSTWVQWLAERGVDSATLIEADDAAFATMQTRAAGQEGWVCRHQVVADQSGVATYHFASLSSESGLLHPDHLRALWPNLALRQQESRATVALAEALRHPTKAHPNWLVIDCWPALPLLRSLDEEARQALDVVVLRTWLAQDPPASLHQQDWTATLEQLGFRSVATEGTRHPGVGHTVLVRRRADDTRVWQRRVEELQTRLSASEQTAADREAELKAAHAHAQQLQTELAEQAARLAELSAAQGRAVADLAQTRQQGAQLQTLEQSIQRQSEAMAQALQSVQQGMEALLAACQPDAQLQDKLAQWHDTQQEATKALEERLRSDVKKGLDNAVRQVEAYIGIQNFMATGETLSNFHGWPISPDIGLFLLERLQGNPYDLIIEFGSGTSTLLFAKALSVQRRTRGEPEHWDSHPLGKRVVSFEHDLRYHEATRQLLMAHGVANEVDLVHAPLVDWREDDRSYLFYDCDAVLQALAQQLGPSRARILVLVDGPPGATCTNARYPAVPFVFHRLARHQIDVFLDDANRPEEKAAIALWRQFWRKRSMSTSEAAPATEKGLYLAEIC